MASGYLAARFKLLPETASEVLSRFVFVIALPSLIFASLSSITIAEFFSQSPAGALCMKSGTIILTFKPAPA